MTTGAALVETIMATSITSSVLGFHITRSQNMSQVIDSSILFSISKRTEEFRIAKLLLNGKLEQVLPPTLQAPSRHKPRKTPMRCKHSAQRQKEHPVPRHDKAFERLAINTQHNYPIINIPGHANMQHKLIYSF